MQITVLASRPTWDAKLRQQAAVQTKSIIKGPSSKNTCSYWETHIGRKHKSCAHTVFATMCSSSLCFVSVFFVFDSLKSQHTHVRKSSIKSTAQRAFPFVQRAVLLSVLSRSSLMHVNAFITLRLYNTPHGSHFPATSVLLLFFEMGKGGKRSRCPTRCAAGGAIGKCYPRGPSLEPLDHV